MLRGLRHVFRVLVAGRRERAKKRRSPLWTRAERLFRAQRGPFCEGCRSTTNIQVHHERAFEYYPELELDPSNFVLLCMGPRECHFRIGHGGDWKAWNPYVRLHAAMASAAGEIMAETVELLAKEARLYGRAP